MTDANGWSSIAVVSITYTAVAQNTAFICRNHYVKAAGDEPSAHQRSRISSYHWHTADGAVKLSQIICLISRFCADSAELLCHVNDWPRSHCATQLIISHQCALAFRAPKCVHHCFYLWHNRAIRDWIRLTRKVERETPSANWAIWCKHNSHCIRNSLYVSSSVVVTAMHCEVFTGSWVVELQLVFIVEYYSRYLCWFDNIMASASTAQIAIR